MQIIGLYSAKQRLIGKQRQPTGIYKQAMQQVSVNALGIVGDVQADKRFHGGPEKALHQFSLAAYEKIIKRYPLLHKQAWPGALGENLSSPEMHENNVCIGDIYQLGSAVIQVSAPRIPCWKIDAKFNQPGLCQFISQHNISGWYYRVLQNGDIKVGDKLSLTARSNPKVKISTILKVISGTASRDIVDQAMQAQGLDPEWQQRLKVKYPNS